MPLEKVHFHEVGALDSIADIVGVAIGLDLLGVRALHQPARCRPGSGTVKCAHGLMPVPAPATAELLKGVPLRAVDDQGGADHADRRRHPDHRRVRNGSISPAMTIERIGHGAGQRELLEQPNLLRLFVGTASDRELGRRRDQVWVLETNLDDVPAEVVGYCYRAAVRGRGTRRVHARRSR